MKEIIQKIKSARNIAVFTHKNADPDALGSVAAFLHAMESLNINCTVFLNERYQNNFDFLNLKNVVIKEINDKNVVIEESNNSFDLFVSLDAASIDRLGVYKEYFQKHNNKIEIDHHKNRQSFADLSLVKHYSSNVEILLELFKVMRVKITSHIATCLYTGLVGDTDGFKNGATTVLSLKNASEMIALGADINKVNNAIYFNKDKADFLMMKRVIERTEFYNHIAISYIIEKDAKELEKDKFLTSDLINLLTSVKGVEISVLLKQEKGKNYRVSLRSTKNYNVGEFCSRYGGGGHNQAAGMALVGSLKQVKDKILKELKKLEKSK